MSVQILAVEDNELHAENIHFCAEELGYSIINIIDNANECLQILENKKPDIILLDINIQGEINGIKLAEIIKDKFDIPIIFCTSLDDRITIRKAITTQPEAYLNKPIEEKSLANAVEIALYKEKNKETNLQKQIEFKIKDLTEKFNLTSREIDLINLLLNGNDTKTVSEKLFISTNTVKYHSKNLFEKLDIKSRAELSSFFIKTKI